MGSLSKVQACNMIRSASGLAPLSTQVEDPKTVRFLESAIIEMSNGSQPYNTNKVDLVVDNTGKIDVSEYISFVLPPEYKNLVSKDGYLWDSNNNEYYSQDIKGVLVTENISWENIPTAWQYAIAARAACNFLVQFKGYGNELAFCEKRAFDLLCAAELNDPANVSNSHGITDRINGFGGI